MGPIVHPPRAGTSVPTFTLRPWEGSRTWRNLCDTGRGVIHVTDDAFLIARAAIGDVDAAALTTTCSVPGEPESFARLVDCHRWFAIRIDTSIPDPTMPGRHIMRASCVGEGVVRPFFGFNRAKHAVLEAAILATRLQHLPAATIQRQLDDWAVAVQKTGGDDERAAWDLLRAFIRSQTEIVPSRPTVTRSGDAVSALADS